MKKWVLAVIACGLLAQTQEVCAQYVNPVFNLQNKAWFVRYDAPANARNKRGDLAVQLRLMPDPDGISTPQADALKGDIYFYDGAALMPDGKFRYSRRAGAIGKVSVKGTATKVDTNARRKPMRFRAEGLAGNRRVIVMGFAHTGNSKDVRDDDRLTIRVVIKNNQGGGNQGGGNQGGGNQGGGSQGGTNQGAAPQPEVQGTVSTQPCRSCDQDAAMPTEIDGEQLIPVAMFFQQAPDPCEEEPDTDILTEEPYDPANEDPEYVP